MLSYSNHNIIIKVQYNTLNTVNNKIFEIFNNKYKYSIENDNMNFINYNSFKELISDEKHDYDDIVFLYIKNFHKKKPYSSNYMDEKIYIYDDIYKFKYRHESKKKFSKYFSDLYGLTLPILPKNLQFLAIEDSKIDNEFKLPSSLKCFVCKHDKFRIFPKLNINLEFLVLKNLNLIKLPKIPHTVKFLNCSKNKLKLLPELPESLAILNCGCNDLFYLPKLPESLLKLLCYNNSLLILPKLPEQLEIFDCGEANIKIVNYLESCKKMIITNYELLQDNSEYNHIKLHPLYLNHELILNNYNNLINKYTKLKQYIKNFKLPKLPNTLEYLNCGNNNLTSLPELPDSLSTLTVYDNNLESLPKLPTKLKNLICINNKLTSLPKLPKKIKFLNCRNNSLTSLPELPENLEELLCSDNELTILPKLPKSLTHLKCKYTNITRFPKSLISCRNLCRISYAGTEVELTIQQMNFINTIVYGSNKNTTNNIYNNNQNVHNSYIQKCIYDNIQILMSDTE